MTKSPKEPSPRLLIEVSRAMREAEHKNVAEHLAAGFLWSLYPEWFDRAWAGREKLRKALLKTGGREMSRG